MLTTIEIGFTYFSGNAMYPTLSVVLDLLSFDELPAVARKGAQIIHSGKADNGARWVEFRNVGSHSAVCHSREDTFAATRYASATDHVNAFAEIETTSVKLTGVLKTYSDWDNSGLYLHNFLQVGDSVDEALEMHFLEVLPPAYYDSSLTQIGEASDHKGPNGSARYATVQKHGKAWIYTGDRAKRERVQIG